MSWSPSSARASMPDLGALRRFWPAALTLALLVALGASVQFVTAPHHYTASQELRVGALATSIPSPSAQESDPVAQAGTVARALSSQGVLASPQLARAILAHVSAAEQASQRMSVSAVAAALSATHSEGIITLSALWASPSGAEEILAAAVDTLQHDAALLASLAPSAVSARLQAVAPASPATRAAGEESGAWATLLTRLALGVVAALLLPYALAWVVPAAVSAPRPVRS
jgi:hypothetical protein